MGLGNVKDGAKGLGIRLKPSIPAQGPNGAEVTADKLDTLFPPDDWATASVTFVTR